MEGHPGTNTISTELDVEGCHVSLEGYSGSYVFIPTVRVIDSIVLDSLRELRTRGDACIVWNLRHIPCCKTDLINNLSV